ncbi:uncharacterized protein [Drosophila tropicalis]|uniref:uncharacterized protein n=1 Tax=Drosophila tropicalis TaxID=46794 RepID=UPI0035AC18B8
MIHILLTKVDAEIKGVYDEKQSFDKLSTYALTGDIAKMYRQFVIDPRDRRFQRIVWRPTKTEELKTYELNTVTYGMSAAPFLAIRGVHHIADLHSHDHPIGAKTLRNDLYVDDLLTGADSVTELQHIKNDTVDILAQAGLHLTKFSSNCKEITKTSKDEVFIAMDDQDTTKTLGMTWMPSSDIFTFRYICDHQEPFTKRSILSVVARMFDLLGFISPVIVRCKILMQDLTLKGLDWDEPVDGRIKER